jgi:hypothetical protein
MRKTTNGAFPERLTGLVDDIFARLWGLRPSVPRYRFGEVCRPEPLNFRNRGDRDAVAIEKARHQGACKTSKPENLEETHERIRTEQEIGE